MYSSHPRHLRHPRFSPDFFPTADSADSGETGSRSRRMSNQRVDRTAAPPCSFGPCRENSGGYCCRVAGLTAAVGHSYRYAKSAFNYGRFGRCGTKGGFPESTCELDGLQSGLYSHSHDMTSPVSFAVSRRTFRGDVEHRIARRFSEREPAVSLRVDCKHHWRLAPAADLTRSDET
jgi:hypothetical protein